MRNTRRGLLLSLAGFALLAGVAIAQGTNWSGPLMGIVDYTGVQFSSVNPFPVISTNTSATTDASNTITTGGTFQQLVAASTTRKSIEIDNICFLSGKCTSTANNCYLFFGLTASANTNNSIPIPAGGSYLRSTGAIPSDAVQITCDGTGDHIASHIQ